MRASLRLCRAAVGLLLLAPAAATAAEWSWNGYFGANYEAFRNTRKSSFDAYILSMATRMRIAPNLSARAQVDYEHGPHYDVSSSGTNGSKTLDQRSAGEIALSYAYGEYVAADWLKIRAGKFFAPVGVYNQILYAVPTYPAMKIPSVAVYSRTGNTTQDAHYFQRYAQGVWVGGGYAWDEARADYDLYVSNGRSTRGHVDDDNSKAVGGRVKAVLPLPVKVSPLVSFYADRYDARASGSTTEVFQKQYSVLPGVELEAGDFAFRSEGAYSEIINKDGTKNKVMTSIYGEALYTIGERVTPYARYEFTEPDHKTNNDRERETTLGVAYHIKLWEALVKAEYRRHQYEKRSTPAYNAFGVGMALAF